MKRRSCFTLIEILIVIAIIGVMLAVAVVSMSSGRDAALARTAYFTAAKGRMKIDEHRAHWLELEMEEQERRADEELEDFTRRPNDD